ncbi:synaptic vesicle glycoprotein 2B-like protein [Lates japonicus]|uniref:Synaptic vesicle glycoprotein 2B-like protein n=1 Tax=Lates japonicus TaxID=270547 RepID=A0AAD3MIT5_LATJO|nr:synaptic vesicle glycoprotein 2B-like protein [Lates japonicus]
MSVAAVLRRGDKGSTVEVVVGLMDTGDPDRWQAAQPQSLLWVGIHPEVPNSQPGSHSLTSVRVLAGSHSRFNPSFTLPSA